MTTPQLPEEWRKRFDEKFSECEDPKCDLCSLRDHLKSFFAAELALAREEAKREERERIVQEVDKLPHDQRRSGKRYVHYA